MSGPVEPDVFPASPAQERVWFVGMLEPGLPLYNVGLRLPLPAGCGAGTARRALAQVVARHESLRTAFRLEDGPPARLVQLVHPAVPIELPETDLRLTGGDLDAHAEAYIAGPVAPDRAPLWRASLVRVSDDDLRLLVVCHHAVFDGGSSDLFVAELLECCAAELAGRAPRLPELPVQYADYTVWQLDQLTAAADADGAAYWAAALAGLPADLGLPTDRPPPAVRDRRAGIHRFALGPARTAAVNGWSQRNGRTPFMTLLAAFAVLLGRVGDRSDVAVSCPVGVRPLPELQPLIGMFVTSVVVRVDLSGEPSFRTVAARVGAGVLDGVEHSVTAGRLPPQQVGFNLVPSDTRGQIHNGTTLTDLSLDLSLREQVLHATLEYATDVFDHATVERVAEDYLALLDAAVAAPDVPVARLPRPSLAARVEWIDGPPLPEPVEPLVRRIAGHAARSSGRTAVVHDGLELGYADLERAARGLAARLAALAGPPDQPVAIALRHGADAVVAALAALHAGIPFVLLDPDGPPARVRAVLADAGPCAVVAAAADAALAGGIPHLLPGPQPVDCPVPADGPATAPPGACAYLAYTSGSTGTPNGVRIGRLALDRFVAGALERYGVAAADRVLQFAPLQFDASIEEIFVTLGAGATLVVRTAEMGESVPRLLAECERLAVSVLDLPTAYWHELVFVLEQGTARLPTAVHTVIIGGEAALPSRVAGWHAAVGSGVRLINTYGPTEATVVATAAELGPDAEHEPGPDDAVPIGLPLPGVRAAVVDGELYLAGGGLAEGYHRRPGLTARRFVAVEGVRAYRTGDRVRRGIDGQLEFVGRVDDELKISGYRVDPAAVESVLTAHPGVREAAVVPASVAAGGVRLVAYVVVPGAPLSFDGLPEELRRHVGAVLPGPMVPAEVVAVEQLPRTANGKLDRAALRPPPPGGGGRAHGATQPRDEHERLVLEVWQEVLGVRPAGVDDDFFALGGQSLQTIQVATRLGAALRRDVALSTVFAHPTAAGLARALASAAPPAAGPPAAGPPLVVLPPDVRPRPGPARTAARAGTVLLTGATGFVGRYLLRELVRHDGLRVVCAVRAADDAEAARRVAAVLGAAPDRVEVVAADLAAPRLGLSADVFAELADRVDAIYHAGAEESLARGYDSLRAANVDGTAEVLRLAATGRVSAVHHVSTVAAATPPSAGEGGYRASKWAAEQLVEQAVGRGLAVSVYRLGRVTGPTTGDEVNPDDLVWRVLRAGVAVGMLPELDVVEPWTPVDWVARTLVALSRADDGPAVHALLPEAPVSWAAVFDQARGYGFALPATPVGPWLEAVRRHPEHAAVAVALGAPAGNPPIDAPRGGRPCPPTDVALVHAYLRTAVREGILPAPGRE